MLRGPPGSQLPDTLFPYPPPSRSHAAGARPDVDQLPFPGREREPALQVDHAESGRAAGPGRVEMRLAVAARHAPAITRSEEHTSELQSLMRISYAVFCLKKKK